MTPLPQARLDLTALARLPDAVRRPSFDPAALRIGMVHLGLGAFHRAHQGTYTDDAIAAEGGDWGTLGVSLRGSDTPRTLAAQDGLYAVETLDDARTYRVIGSLRGALSAVTAPERVLDAIAAPQVHVLTLTVTEKGYGLAPGGGLDLSDPQVAADLRGEAAPTSTVGWLVRGLQARRAADGGGLTVISCDNLMANGDVVRAAVATFAEAVDPPLARWIEDRVRFPNSMVDCITPASDAALRSRVAAALGWNDAACVQREPFAQWVLEDDFAGPRPAWEAAGAELTQDAVRFQKMKLHVLNTANSALAYLGLVRGHEVAHEAAADPQIAAFVDALILEEMAAALPDLPVAAYWRAVRPRLANPHVRHALRQIGEDGSAKLAQRVFGPLAANLRAGRPWRRLATLVRTWIVVAERGLVKDPQAATLQAIGRSGGGLAAVLAAPHILPAAFRDNAAVRAGLSSCPPFGGDSFSACGISKRKGIAE